MIPDTGKKVSQLNDTTSETVPIADPVPAFAVVSTLPDAASDQRRTAAVLAAGWLLTWLSLGICVLPINLYLKNRLLLGPGAVAFFTLATSFAWNLKPIAGLLSDNVPLFGSRRKSYLLLSSAAGGACWLLLFVLPSTYSVLLWVLVIVNTMVMIGSTALGGLLVEAGNRNQSIGRLTSQRLAISNMVTLIAGPIGGYLASRAFGLTVGICSGCLIALTPIVALFLREERIVKAAKRSWKAAGIQFKTMLRSRPLW